MNDKTFVDTNVLVYAHDLDEHEKRARAHDVLRTLWENGTGIVSPQVLQEFYVTVTRKIRRPIAKHDARRIVDAYAHWCVTVDAADVAAAFRIEDEALLGFWDALILASAARSGAVRLLTEDLNAGQVIAGVAIENPFAP
jgi:predicted nucleic acid-binding protein